MDRRADGGIGSAVPDAVSRSPFLASAGPPAAMTDLELLTAPDQPLADASEPELVRTAQTAVSRCNWVVGRCAAEWTRRYSRGRTDADFAQLVGLSADQVYQRRRVWETFGDVVESYASLKWSHFYAAVAWDDAPECLQWAEDNESTVSEMRAWRRASRGEDASETPEASPLADDPLAGPLPAFASEVRSPDAGGSSRRRGEPRDGSDEDSDAPFAAGSVSSANRETAGDAEYAPFRKGAASTPAESHEDHPAEEPAAQIARRVAGTLERLVGVLNPETVAAFRSLPERDRSRLVVAARAVAERVEALETQAAW